MSLFLSSNAPLIWSFFHQMRWHYWHNLTELSDNLSYPCTAMDAVRPPNPPHLSTLEIAEYCVRLRSSVPHFRAGQKRLFCSLFVRDKLCLWPRQATVRALPSALSRASERARSRAYLAHRRRSLSVAHATCAIRRTLAIALTRSIHEMEIVIDSFGPGQRISIQTNHKDFRSHSVSRHEQNEMIGSHDVGCCVRAY